MVPTAYHGNVSVTISGRVCQAWAAQWPNSHNYKDINFPYESVEEASNYCRDPDQYSKLWCFTIDRYITSMEDCHVPECAGNHLWLCYVSTCTGICLCLLTLKYKPLQIGVQAERKRPDVRVVTAPDFGTRRHGLESRCRRNSA